MKFVDVAIKAPVIPVVPSMAALVLRSIKDKPIAEYKEPSNDGNALMIGLVPVRAVTSNAIASKIEISVETNKSAEAEAINAPLIST